MAATECWVVGCESSAYEMFDLTPDRESFSLPGEVYVCPLHRAELEKPGTEWIYIRDERKVYVGDSLRELNEYVLVGIPDSNLVGYGSAREFSNPDDDGHELRLRVRRRGDREKEMTLVIPSDEISRELKVWVKSLPPGD